MLTHSHQPANHRNNVPAVVVSVDQADNRLKLSPKGHAYLERHFAEREGKDLVSVTAVDSDFKITGPCDDMDQFMFVSLTDITDQQWDQIRRRLVGHTRNMIEKYQAAGANADAIATRIIDRTQSGKCTWNRAVQPNLLQHLFDVVRGVIKCKAKQQPSSLDVMDVMAVMERFPRVAAIINQLNDLLNSAQPKTEVGEQ